MKNRLIVAALACTGLFAQSGCLSTAKDKTVSAVTAPTRWFKSSSDKKKAEEKRKLSTKEKAAEGVEPTIQEQQPTEFQEAVQLVKQRKFAPALKILDKLLEDQPHNDQLFQWKGDCHYNLLELDKAIAAYKTARELNPNNHLALRGMGFAELYLGHQYAKNNDSDKAIEHYTESITLLRKVLQVWSADSEAQFAKSMSIDSCTKFLFQRACNLRQRGDKQGAEKVTRECLNLCNEGIEAAKFRIQKHMEQAEPRVIVGNLFLIRARLLQEFDLPNPQVDLEKAKVTYTSILREISPDHEYAQRQVDLCNELAEQWKNAKTAN